MVGALPRGKKKHVSGLLQMMENIPEAFLSLLFKSEEDSKQSRGRPMGTELTAGNRVPLEQWRGFCCYRAPDLQTALEALNAQASEQEGTGR